MIVATLPRTSKWIVSVDLGQSIDPTAISVLQVMTRQDAVTHYYNLTEEERESPDVLRPPLDWYRTAPGSDSGVMHPHAMVRVDVRHLERLPLRTTYPDVVTHIENMLRRPPLSFPRAALVVDMTGVGRPVVDLLRRAGLDPVGVTITAGDGETRTPEGDFRVAKLLLVSRLQALLHSGELRIAKSLAEARTLAIELQDFRANISESGFTRFGAREGQHDDLVLAVACGAWYASRNRQATVRTVYI
jgi:hypothetical protein